eukprot:CAMPEP_0176436884 /NCGR_PEP_ID=MMETSP0127-20121128/18257_1 /TAXON_ID=938130 /ORGANISM="Platyophrya macrostoma, Strain WH" /LENGTH=144 /DNA_ID=CAMNT_0017820335 /DNA_START=372 /DNA_END=807 /DNA_ORIENTATION=-
MSEVIEVALKTWLLQVATGGVGPKSIVAVLLGGLFGCGWLSSASFLFLRFDDLVLDVVDIEVSAISCETLTSEGLTSIEGIFAAIRAGNLLGHRGLKNDGFKSLSARSGDSLAVALAVSTGNEAVAGFSDVTDIEFVSAVLNHA